MYHRIIQNNYHFVAHSFFGQRIAEFGEIQAAYRPDFVVLVGAQFEELVHEDRFHKLWPNKGTDFADQLWNEKIEMRMIREITPIFQTKQKREKIAARWEIHAVALIKAGCDTRLWHRITTTLTGPTSAESIRNRRMSHPWRLHVNQR